MFKILLRLLLVLLVIWLGLTIWVNLKGPSANWDYGQPGSGFRAMIVFDPDPIYDLDLQLCREFALVLASKGWFVKVMTVRYAEQMETSHPDLWVLCANTYNWQPDRSIRGFLKNTELADQAVVAITLGAGSTANAQNGFEKLINMAGARLIHSSAYWLLRPNDENKRRENNVEAAKAQVRRRAAQLADSLFMHKPL